MKRFRSAVGNGGIQQIGQGKGDAGIGEVSAFVRWHTAGEHVSCDAGWKFVLVMEAANTAKLSSEREYAYGVWMLGFNELIGRCHERHRG